MLCVVIHSFNLNISVRGMCIMMNFESSLVYIASSRKDRAKQRSSVFKGFPIEILRIQASDL